MTFKPIECACWIAADIASVDIVHSSFATTYGSVMFCTVYMGAITTYEADVLRWISVIASARP